MNTTNIEALVSSDRRPTRTEKVPVESQSMLEITAEKTLRDIAKRNGEAVRKRRSVYRRNTGEYAL
jgi:hypothetical protein